VARLRALSSRPQEFGRDRDTETVRWGAFTVAVLRYVVLGVWVSAIRQGPPARVGAGAATA
jgi:hypothetical protein